jgi:hypothetical protein
MNNESRFPSNWGTVFYCFLLKMSQSSHFDLQKITLATIFTACHWHH